MRKRSTAGGWLANNQAEKGRGATLLILSMAKRFSAAMKAKGITVYTVGFEIGGSSSVASQTLQQCATDPNKYYNADDGEELKQAFRDIALKLSSLYISK